MLGLVAIQLEPIEIAAPSFGALRVWSDVPYIAMKEFFSIARIEEGRFEYWTRGHVFAGRRGSVLIQQPGDIHRDIARDGPVALQLVRFPSHVVERVDRHRLSACLSPDDERGASLQRLHDAVSMGADAFTLECLIAEAVESLADIRDPRPNQTRPVRRALEMLHERLTEQLTLDDLARHADFDKYHLCRAFRAEVGIPPHAYLTRLRIIYAKELLASGARPKDVAPQVGLYDQSQLNRHFRRIVGMTPGQYQRAV
jgi:AraC-like DNA-binding protein